jgi:hypothetical protein
LQWVGSLSAAAHDSNVEAAHPHVCATTLQGRGRQEKIEFGSGTNQGDSDIDRGVGGRPGSR